MDRINELATQCLVECSDNLKAALARAAELAHNSYKGIRYSDFE